MNATVEVLTDMLLEVNEKGLLDDYFTRTALTGIRRQCAVGFDAESDDFHTYTDLTGLFSWCDTPEGSTFWTHVHNVLDTEYEEGYRADNDDYGNDDDFYGDDDDPEEGDYDGEVFEW